MKAIRIAEYSWTVLRENETVLAQVTPLTVVLNGRCSLQQFLDLGPLVQALTENCSVLEGENPFTEAGDITLETSVNEAGDVSAVFTLDANLTVGIVL